MLGGKSPWFPGADVGLAAYVPLVSTRPSKRIVEYASNCEAPIVHKAGDIRAETSGTSHWWKNLGKKTVVLYVGDLLHDRSDKNM
jgi:hypothetical protein